MKNENAQLKNSIYAKATSTMLIYLKTSDAGLIDIATHYYYVMYALVDLMKNSNTYAGFIVHLTRTVSDTKRLKTMLDELEVIEYNVEKRVGWIDE